MIRIVMENPSEMHMNTIPDHPVIACVLILRDRPPLPGVPPEVMQRLPPSQTVEVILTHEMKADLLKLLEGEVPQQRPRIELASSIPPLHPHHRP